MQDNSKRLNGSEEAKDRHDVDADEQTGATDASVGDEAVQDDADVAGQPSDDAGDEEAEARYKELSDRYLRLAADFDNFRRRTRQNEAAVREQAAANLIQDLLPIIDNLQLALAKVDVSDDAFAAGVVLIEQQLMAALQNHGVRVIETAGQPFDPNFMEAVAQVDAQGQAEPGHVVEELRRGYLLHDKVLRPAQVVVAQSE